MIRFGKHKARETLRETVWEWKKIVVSGMRARHSETWKKKSIMSVFLLETSLRLNMSHACQGHPDSPLKLTGGRWGLRSVSLLWLLHLLAAFGILRLTGSNCRPACRIPQVILSSIFPREMPLAVASMMHVSLRGRFTQAAFIYCSLSAPERPSFVELFLPYLRLKTFMTTAANAAF